MKRKSIETSALDRQVLRLLGAYRQITDARNELGMSSNLYDIVDETAVLVEIRRLLVLAIDYSNEIKRESIVEILEQSKEEDDKTMAEAQAKQVAKAMSENPFAKFIESMNQQSQSCRVCNQHLCGGCGKCHDCEARKGAPVN
jgi:hypothetical protein